MAMKGSTVRGTPIHHVGNTSREGMSAGTPKGMKGTSPEQYDSDRRGYQSDPRGGTPYRSETGNGSETRRVVSSDRYGKVESNQQRNANDPLNNGHGVVFDGANEYSRGYAPRGEASEDSPVPRGAPVFDAGFIASEDRAHAGRGNEQTARDDILSIGGVLSRGMVGTSKANGPENELTQDDTGGLRGADTGHMSRERE
jgi:hypothetical protein